MKTNGPGVTFIYYRTRPELRLLVVVKSGYEWRDRMRITRSEGISPDTKLDIFGGGEDKKIDGRDEEIGEI